MLLKKLTFWSLLMSISIATFAQNSEHIISKLDYNYFEKQLSYLSDDKLKGRDTGSEGYDLAAKHVANEFNKLGLLPGAENNSYFQYIDFVSSKILHNTVNFNAENNENNAIAEYGKSVTLLPVAKYGNVNENQEIVFVGYGNITKKLDLNDYKNVDVKGKTVLVSIGGPKDLKSNDFWDFGKKAENAKNNGATGIILFYPGKVLQKLVFKNIHRYLSSPILVLKDTSIRNDFSSFDYPISAMAKSDFLKKLFKMNDLKLKKEIKNMERGLFVSKPLKTKLNCSFNLKVKNTTCKNVVATLPGSDPILKNEYIVICGHMDHVGITTPVKGDSICNGMWDNASGTAAIMAMAKAFSELPEKPKRSILFVCLTGEEKGLLGSAYFAKNMKIPNGKIVAALNIDMLGAPFETQDVIPLGYSHSNLYEAVNFAAKQVNVIVDDNKKEENEYIMRSDQMSFFENGIPALNIGTGYTPVNAKINVKKEIDKWMKKTYHQPSDDLNQSFEKDGFFTPMKVNYLTAYYMANNMKTITWNKDSWIYKKYVAKEKP